MDIIRTHPFKFTLHGSNELMLNHVDTQNAKSVTKTHFLIGIDWRSSIVYLFLFTLMFSFSISHGLIYDGCDKRTVESGQVQQQQQGDNVTTLHFAVILAATERNDRSGKCEILNWGNVRNLLAVQWVVDKLNNNQTFIPGYNIDFHVFDDCGQPDIAFKHIADIIEPSLTSEFNKCSNLHQKTNPPFFGILTLGNASITNTILEVAKISSIPVINPKVNLNSFQKYRNFISLSVLIDYEVQAILHLLQKLNWTYSGIVYSHTESGEQMKNLLMSNSIKHGICFAFDVSTSNIDVVEFEIANAIKRTKLNQLGIVYIGDGSDMEIVFKNNPKIHWIIFDSFGGQFKSFQTMPNSLKGALTLYPVNVDVDAFEVEYVKKTKDLMNNQNANEPIDHWINNLLKRINQKLTYTPTVDELKDDLSCVMDAVYVLATAKREICHKIPQKCIQLNKQYSDEKTVVNYTKMASFSPREFREQNRIITILNNTIKQEKSPGKVFNILNFWDGKLKKVGTFSQDYQLNVTLDQIKMRDEKDNTVTGNELPKSLCSQVCEECQQPEFRGDIAYIPGDILLLGIFSVHDSGPGFQCGEFRKDSTDAIASEAFLYAIKHLNKVFPNITVGGIAIDDCYNSIQTIMNITMILSGEKKLSNPYTGQIIDPRKIVAVIGPLSSGVTKSVADLLTHEKTLMISYAASSPDLDDKISYPYFLRTVPSDVQQVNAIIALLNQLDWRYVGIIYANNNYGAKAKELFISSAQNNRICVSLPKAIEESSEKAETSELENVLDDLMKDQVKIVVYFGTNSRVNDLVAALKRKNMENVFVFIGSETWGVTNIANLQTVAGSLTLTLDGSQTADKGQFKNYLAKRTIKSGTVNNLFFNMFWYNFHECNPMNGFRNKYEKECTGSEHFSNEDVRKFARDQRSVQTMNAVYAVYKGIEEFQKTECKYISKVPCDRFSTHVDKFVSIMKKIKLDGYDDDFKVFNNDGNGQNTFNIHNIQRKGSEYVYELVGHYNVEYNLALRMVRLRFYDRRLQQLSYVNVTCVSPYNCCDQIEPIPQNLSQTSIRTVDIVILSLLSFLFVFLIALGACYLFCYNKKQKTKRPSDRSMFQNGETTLNAPDTNGLNQKRPPTVYIRTREPSEHSSYQGVVAYQIVKTQGNVTQLTPISQTNSTPDHARAPKLYTNSCFEPDDVFLFPETESQSGTTSYEEVASPKFLERAVVLPHRPMSDGNKPQLPTPRYNSDGDPNRSNSLQEDIFII